MSTETKWLQEFFNKVPSVSLLDPLGEILGAVAKGEPFVFTYKDTVKMAGHSCPAVSSAYKITLLALKSLYGEDLPVRGDVRILIKGGADQLAYGPQSQVFSLITGAALETGFKGLGGKYSRYNKLVFDPEDFQFNTYIFQRADNGKAVKVVYDPSALPEEAELSELAPLVMRGNPTEKDHTRFIELWQGKVRSILLNDKDYPGLFTVEELTDFKFRQK